MHILLLHWYFQSNFICILCLFDVLIRLNKSAERKQRCSTHPHNIYLEILSETGIIVFLPFLILNIFIFLKLIKSYFFEKKNKKLILISFCSFIVMFFPIQTTGSFFSTWNGFYYWLVYSFIAFTIRKKHGRRCGAYPD